MRWFVVSFVAAVVMGGITASLATSIQAAQAPKKGQDEKRAAAPVPREPTLSGTVRGPDGKPAREAEVLLADGYVPVGDDGRPFAPAGKRRHHGGFPIVRG